MSRITRKPLVINDPHRPRIARTIADMLAVIEAAIEHDGPGTIEPGSLDTHGMTIMSDGLNYRLEIRDEERVYPSQEAYERGADFDDDNPADRDWMADSGQDIDF
jgi:hypothetical protein